jgi:hypothetical protein
VALDTVFHLPLLDQAVANQLKKNPPVLPITISNYIKLIAIKLIAIKLIAIKLIAPTLQPQPPAPPTLRDIHYFLKNKGLPL